MARRLFSTMAVLFLLAAATTARAQEDMKILVEPEQVKVGLFYGGREIQVRAEMPAGYDEVIKVTGRSEDLELKEKGKKAGVLWMSVAEVSYHDVPSVFILRSSRPLENLGSAAALKRLGIGYDALEAEVTADADGNSRSLFGELIKLKEKMGLYSIDENGIEISQQGSGSEQASASFFLPPKAPRGEYQVEIFGFKNGKGSLLGSRTITLKFTPATAFISNMAREHGLIYGCLASAIAIIAGLITGYVFGGKGETH